jgi:hypothetical protein
VAFAVLVALFISCVLVLPQYLVDHDRDPSAKGAVTQTDMLEARNDVRTTLLQGFGTLVAIAGVIVTLRANSERGQETERFVKSVEQLGGEKTEVRIAGVYALESLASTSARDRPTIVQILSGFIRRSGRVGGEVARMPPRIWLETGDCGRSGRPRKLRNSLPRSRSAGAA